MSHLSPRRVAALLASTVALSLSQPAYAGEVTLRSIDSSFAAKGEFISFADGIYTINTTLGEMMINASTVTCEGFDCGTTSAPAAPTTQIATQPATQPTTQIAADVRFVGSDTVGDGLMPLLLAGYGAQHNAAVEAHSGAEGQTTVELIGDEGYGEPIGVFQVDSSTSSSAFPALLAREAEFGMASRRIKRAEARALSQDGAGSMIALEQEHIVAVDSLVVIVHPSNPVRAITMANLAAIYRGTLQNWSELGGPDLPITALSRSEDSGTRATFELNVLGTSTAGQQVEIADSNISMTERVSTEAGAIGFVGYAFVQNAQPLSLISACGIETAANAFSAKTEEYPMQRRLYLYTRQDNTTETGQQFLEYALSSAADGVVEKSGYISLGVERISQELARNRAQAIMDETSSVFELNLMREMVLEMYQWDRLSSTLRFASGANNLERKSELDLDRLVEYLQNQPAGTKIAVVGFTDSDGVFGANRSLSQRRAARVLADIQARANGSLSHIAFESMGFGELAPADCNTDGDGKRINRRVEVWIQ